MPKTSGQILFEIHLSVKQAFIASAVTAMWEDCTVEYRQVWEDTATQFLRARIFQNATPPPAISSSVAGICSGGGDYCNKCETNQLPKWKPGSKSTARACQKCGYVDERVLQIFEV